jgi:HD-GYP domain-containing protein (c-di-GMP phosphodiesterase class II)
VREACPSSCEVFRSGGDEFAVVLTAGGPEEALGIARRIVALWREQENAADQVSVDVSVGVASLPARLTDADGALEAARHARKIARASSVDKVSVFDGLGPDGYDPRTLRMALRDRARRDALVDLARVADARDETARAHSQRVATLATAFAEALGMPADECGRIHSAALVHDVGKIGVPRRLLTRPGGLSEQEWDEVRAHPGLGSRMLASAGMADLAAVVRSHHERWDGTGYPDGLAGPDIPADARLIAVCDAFETLLSPRPYREAHDVEGALAEIEMQAGRQFDPVMAERFARLVRSRPEVVPGPAL